MTPFTNFACFLCISLRRFCILTTDDVFGCTGSNKNTKTHQLTQRLSINIRFFRLHHDCHLSRLFVMMTSSNGNIFRVTGHLCGEFTGPGEFPTQWPVTRIFDVLFDLRLNKRLSKQSWGWWFETISWSLWRQCIVSSRWFCILTTGHLLLRTTSNIKTRRPQCTKRR